MTVRPLGMKVEDLLVLTILQPGCSRLLPPRVPASLSHSAPPIVSDSSTFLPGGSAQWTLERWMTGVCDLERGRSQTRESARYQCSSVQVVRVAQPGVRGRPTMFPRRVSAEDLDLHDMNRMDSAERIQKMFSISHGIVARIIVARVPTDFVRRVEEQKTKGNYLSANVVATSTLRFRRQAGWWHFRCISPVGLDRQVFSVCALYVSSNIGRRRSRRRLPLISMSTKNLLRIPADSLMDMVKPATPALLMPRCAFPPGRPGPWGSNVPLGPAIPMLEFEELDDVAVP